MSAFRQVNLGKTYYRRAIAFVDDMSGYIVRNNLAYGFSVAAARLQFDIMLQYVLMETALADGNFTVGEGYFLDNITDYGDMINSVRAYGNNWEEIAYHYNNTTFRALVNKMAAKAGRHIASFANLFGTLNSRIPNRYLAKELTDLVVGVAMCFISADGKAAKQETDVAYATVERVLGRPWMTAMYR